jgi:hypothetical protein
VFCAYFEYEGTENPPELTATATTNVIAPPPPCVVPGFAFSAPLHPGSIVYVHISGYPPGSRVRVQLATRRSLHSNCCVSLTYPRVHAAGAPVNQNGSATIRWRVPTQYAQCVSSICSSPEYKTFRRGESVLVDVSTTDDTAFAASTARIT